MLDGVPGDVDHDVEDEDVVIDDRVRELLAEGARLLAVSRALLAQLDELTR